ncbi:MAG TPA: outer membrane beta-barrel protein [Flavobacterium sp.]|nr:outer membrane beta-barrel protein [Flavobacterium sp.]
MKKVLLSLAVLATGVAVQAQEGFGFKEGDILLEGSLQLNSGKESGTMGGTDVSLKESTTFFNPKAGYFINDQFVLGVELGVGSYKQIQEVGSTESEEKSNGFYAGVFGRYYFLELGQRFKTYSELGVGMNNTKYTDNIGNVSKTSGFGAGLGLGINYFVTPKIAINFGLSDLLHFSTEKDKNTDMKTTESGANINVFDNFFSTASFGLTFKL